MPGEILDGDIDAIVKRLNDHMKSAVGHWPSPSEQNAWRASLPILANLLIRAGLDQVEMLVEYRLPFSGKRADVVLAGTHPKTGNDSYVVVELKQWSTAHLEDGPETSVVVPGMKGGSVLHPVEQVRGYVGNIHHFLGIFNSGRAELHGAVLLHNAHKNDVSDLLLMPPDEDGQLFTRDQFGKFEAFLRSCLAGDGATKAGDRFLASPQHPSPVLMTTVEEVINGSSMFRLLDEQQLAYDQVVHAVEKSLHADTKTVVVIVGGPGSGKSVIALTLLGSLYRADHRTLHATGSRSFTTTLQEQLKNALPDLRMSAPVKGVFKYFNSFMKSAKNGLDVLICDEAHRIRRVSANRWTKAADRTDKLQVAELIEAARVPVFLLDDHQVVKPDEIGSADFIIEHAESQGHRVVRVDLKGQFRCGGSDAYDLWVRRLLGVESGGPIPWIGDENYNVEIVDTPHELERRVKAKGAEGLTGRMTAGYCWSWRKPNGHTLPNDIRIGDWERPWNAKSDKDLGDIPRPELWATKPGGIGQVGCVYTAQGFEYDWNGVILGPDIVARDGRLVTVRSENKDRNLTKKTPDDEVDRHIRNIYNVLLTRGMRGTTIYSVNPETREFLAGLLPGI